MPLRLAQPPGVRSCRDGGDWEICRSSAGATLWYDEFERLKAALAPSERSLLIAELADKMAAGRGGELIFRANDHAGCDVDQMACAPNVLELRLSSYNGGDEGRLLVRMYFSEPADQHRQMLVLLLTWKQPGPIGLEQQNGHARTAERRGDEHCARR